jgi:hypothetical protein
MQPGDLVFCTTTGVLGKAIRFAQRRNKEVDWKRNHVAALDRFENGVWYVIQAEPHGVTSDKQLLNIAIGGTFEIRELPSVVDAEKFLEYLRSRVGDDYSFSTIASCALNMIFPERLYFRWANGLICSGLIALALTFGGFAPMETATDLYSLTPAQVMSLTQDS